MRELLRQKIIDSLAAPLPAFTRRDVRLPGIAGKAVAVIGPRRGGKTTFLWQVLAAKLGRALNAQDCSISISKTNVWPA